MKKFPSFFDVWRNSGYTPLQTMGLSALVLPSISSVVITAAIYIVEEDKRSALPKSIVIFSLLFCVFGIVIYLFPILQKYRILLSVFKTGIEVKGEILEQYFIVGSGYITFQYNFDGQNYRRTDHVLRTRKNKALIPGKFVVVILDRDDHKIAFVKEAYL